MCVQFEMPNQKVLHFIFNSIAFILVQLRLDYICDARIIIFYRWGGGGDI